MTQKYEILNYIEINIDDTHTSIANLLYKLYNKNYCVTTESNKDKWFRFNKTYWESSSSIKHEIKNKLSSDIFQLIAEVRNILREKIMAKLDENKTKWERERIRTLLGLEKKLYNTHFKDAIIKECESIFYQENLPDIKSI
jgi:predicted transcriptional regulator